MKGVASAYQRAWWRGSPTGHCLDHVSHKRETANLAFPQTVAKWLQERFQKTWHSRCTHEKVNFSDANNDKNSFWWAKSNSCSWPRDLDRACWTTEQTPKRSAADWSLKSPQQEEKRSEMEKGSMIIKTGQGNWWNVPTLLRMFLMRKRCLTSKGTDRPW